MNEQLQRLIDENEIKRLVLTWIDGVDTRSVEKIVSVWAEEMETEFEGFPDMGTGPIAAGKQRTAERAPGLIRMLSHFTVTQHVNTNHLVTLDGDQATCSSYVLATHHFACGSGNPWSIIGARYDVNAQRFHHGWRLTKLKWTKLWTSGNDAIWAEVGKRLSAGPIDAVNKGQE